jgi:uncharacterized protein (TIGR03083 family)
MDTNLQRLRASATVLVDAIRTGPLDAQVAACPGWDLGDLARHMGFIHRWARHAATTGAPPNLDDIEAPPADADLADWVAVGAESLATALASLDPDEPTWHPFPVPKVARVWPRRQACETTIHAWDAVNAIGGSFSLDAATAADNVAEFFEVIAPRIITRDGRSVPHGAITIRCTDTGDEFTIRSVDGSSLERTHIAPDAVLAAPAEDLCLAMWHRRSLAEPPEAPLALAWLAFGGN